MLSAGKWKIYSRYGTITININKDIILNKPSTITPPDSLFSKYMWFSESRKHKSEVLDIWRTIKKIHPNVKNIQIIQVEDYYSLIIVS